jgi:hypothetical protein
MGKTKNSLPFELATISGLLFLTIILNLVAHSESIFKSSLCGPLLLTKLIIQVLIIVATFFHSSISMSKGSQFNIKGCQFSSRFVKKVFSHIFIIQTQS